MSTRVKICLGPSGTVLSTREALGGGDGAILMEQTSGPLWKHGGQHGLTLMTFFFVVVVVVLFKATPPTYGSSQIRG